MQISHTGINQSALTLNVTFFENILSLRLTGWIFSLPIRSHITVSEVKVVEKLCYNEIVLGVL